MIIRLTDDDIIELGSSCDQRITGWGMVYLAYAYPEKRNVILKSALNKNNPRIREYACDVIGDESIHELKELMFPLITDNDSSVSEAAAYNYYEMFD